MKIDLTGKIALVTGGTGELGRVIARTLAECGADVAIHYHTNGTKAREIAAEIQKRGQRSLVVQADVTDQKSVCSMADEININLGHPDIVVANAVIQIHPWLSVLEEDPEDYESQFRSCVMQSVYLAKSFIPSMKEKGWGRYIAINTECAMEANANSSAYVSGKRGLDGIVRILAKEVGEHQITVNQVAPGWMISDKYRSSAADDTAYKGTIPLKRRGHDQDIANAVAFLASDLAAFITGVYLPVCGGRIMPGI